MAALRVVDVARLLGVSYGEARNRLNDGRITAYRDGKVVWTTEADLAEYLERCKVAPPVSVSVTKRRTPTKKAGRVRLPSGFEECRARFDSY